jgi:2'-hydroxyisoflavone reductase
MVLTRPSFPDTLAAMSNTYSRRALLASALAAGVAGSASPKAALTRKKILILGGTGFLGPATVAAAQARGHQLTLFNRGKTRPGLFPNIETLLGDRDPDKGEGLKALAGRRWDAVIDNSGYFPRQVVASAGVLAPNVGQYIFISSISVYADNSVENQDETARLGTTPDPKVEKITEQTFGPLKALCEQAAAMALPAGTTVVRPGYIVGPDDPSGRFTYWPVRIDRGGEVLAPGSPSDPVQIIDVRDLGSWLVTVIENGTTGTFNAAGPRSRLRWGALLEACRKAAGARSTLAWVDGAWVAKRGEEIFPIWAPYQGETKGFHTWSNARAVKAGLKFRPCAVTVKDTLAWYKTQSAGGRIRLAGPTADKEAKLLAEWRSR